MKITQGCIRYVQDAAAIEQLGQDLYGLESIYLLGGERALSAFLPRFSVADAQINKKTLGHSFTVWADAQALALEVIETGAQAVLGVGGGCMMDLAKAAAVLSGRPVYLVPTVAATCSAATTLIALYDAQGRRTGSYQMPQPVNAVYVDETLLADAPVRTLCSGIADGVAKLSEMASACLFADNPPSPQWRNSMAQALHLMDVYFSHADAAIGGHKQALSEILYANVYLTAQITATGSQRRIGEVAHAFYNGVTYLFPQQRTGFLHGEIVGVGVLLEMELAGTVAGYTKKSITSFLRDVLNCPTTLGQLGLPTDEQSLARLSAYISSKSGLSPTQVVLALGVVLA